MGLAGKVVTDIHMPARQPRHLFQHANVAMRPASPKLDMPESLSLSYEMDNRVLNLKTAEACEIFERNAAKQQRADLAAQARQRGIELRAKSYGAQTEAEYECLEAVYAYERVLAARNGKKTRAQRTWNMIKDHGIISAVERAVDRPVETIGYTALRDMGLEKYAFEMVILRHPDEFSKEAVARSKTRIDEQNSLYSNKGERSSVPN